AKGAKAAASSTVSVLGAARLAADTVLLAAAFAPLAGLWAAKAGIANVTAATRNIPRLIRTGIISDQTPDSGIAVISCSLICHSQLGATAGISPFAFLPARSCPAAHRPALADSVFAEDRAAASGRFPGPCVRQLYLPDAA